MSEKEREKTFSSIIMRYGAMSLLLRLRVCPWLLLRETEPPAAAADGVGGRNVDDDNDDDEDEDDVARAGMPNEVVLVLE